jgi:hypothetical protein
MAVDDLGDGRGEIAISTSMIPRPVGAAWLSAARSGSALAGTSGVTGSALAARLPPPHEQLLLRQPVRTRYSVSSMIRAMSSSENRRLYFAEGAASSA